MRCRLHPRPLPALLASLALDAERVVTGDSLRARVGWRNAVGSRVAARQPAFLGTHFAGRQDAGLSRALPRCPVRLRIGVVHVVVGVQGLEPCRDRRRYSRHRRNRPELAGYPGIRHQLALESDMIAHRRLLILVASAMTLMTASAWAATGAEVLKMLNRDSDQTLEIAEVIDAATKLFAQINPDNDLTLERKETQGRLTDADWKAVNKDNDNTLEMDEWLTIVRQRFNAADANKDGKLTVQELDSAAGQSLIKLIVK